VNVTAPGSSGYTYEERYPVRNNTITVSVHWATFYPTSLMCLASLETSILRFKLHWLAMWFRGRCRSSDIPAWVLQCASWRNRIS